MQAEMFLVPAAGYPSYFYLFYLRLMGSFALNTYSAALQTIARQDLLDFYAGCLTSSIDLTRKVTETMLSKGLFIRPPYITLPNKVDFVERKDFLAGFFGERRNMIAGEIGEFHNNIQMNNTIKAILLEVSQVAKQDKIKNLIIRGRGISNKHIEIFSSKLKEEDIPAATTWDTFVTDATEAPFSDKLLLYHTIALTSAGFINYSISMAASMRHDIQADYIRLLGEN